MIHGHAERHLRSSEYTAWCSMKARCFNVHSTNWKRYGGRGITVCDRWFLSFEDFLADVGLKPQEGLSLDRINNNGNYEPGNVRWVDKRIQASNRRPRACSRSTLERGISKRSCGYQVTINKSFETIEEAIIARDRINELLKDLQSTKNPVTMGL